MGWIRAVVRWLLGALSDYGKAVVIGFVASVWSAVTPVLGQIPAWTLELGQLLLGGWAVFAALSAWDKHHRWIRRTVPYRGGILCDLTFDKYDRVVGDVHGFPCPWACAGTSMCCEPDATEQLRWRYFCPSCGGKSKGLIPHRVDQKTCAQAAYDDLLKRGARIEDRDWRFPDATS